MFDVRIGVKPPGRGIKHASTVGVRLGGNDLQLSQPFDGVGLFASRSLSMVIAFTVEGNRATCVSLCQSNKSRVEEPNSVAPPHRTDDLPMRLCIRAACGDTTEGNCVFGNIRIQIEDFLNAGVGMNIAAVVLAILIISIHSQKLRPLIPASASTSPEWRSRRGFFTENPR